MRCEPGLETISFCGGRFWGANVAERLTAAELRLQKVLCLQGTGNNIYDVEEGWSSMTTEQVAKMRADHESGHAPSHEPLFEGSHTKVPCKEQENVHHEHEHASVSLVA